MYYNDINENYDSETDLILDQESHLETIENEKHFDKYFDEIEKTYEDLQEYVKYRADNKELLKNLNDYMYLEPLFDNHEYKFSETFKRKLKIIEKFEKKDNIYIPPPIDMTELLDDNGNFKQNEKQEWVVLKPKVNEATKKRQEKRKIKKQKREEKKRLEMEKQKLENMRKKTSDIMKRYGFM